MFDALYAGFAGLIANISNFMYSYLLIILLLAAGVYFTCRSKFVQLRLLGESIRVVSEKSDDKHAVSAFEALMVSTASRVGTGNIVGVANAIAIGGYGSVFWMWLIALVGGATAFVESTLAQIYKKRDEQGGSYGGPSYYIQAALKSRFLGVVFAVALVATYAGGFNMLASFNLIDSMSSYSFYGHTVTLMGRQFALVPVLGGALLAILVGICIMGSGARDGRAVHHHGRDRHGAEHRHAAPGAPAHLLRRLRREGHLRRCRRFRLLRRDAGHQAGPLLQ